MILRSPRPAMHAMLAMIAAVALPAAAAPHLNDTGIAACTNGVDFVDCGDTGQDAEFGRDVTHPGDRNGRLGFRFTPICGNGEAAGMGSCPAQPVPGSGSHQWACTRDEVTGRLWENKSAAGGAHDGSRVFTFYSPQYDPDGQYGSRNDAAGFVAQTNAARLCGTDGWRLPTPAELVSVVDMGITALPAIDTRFLPNTVATLYWAAGTDARDDELAWGVDFAFGFGAISAQFRSDPRPVRLVNTRETAPGPRFRISADGQEVDDRATGLVWRRCVEGQHFDGSGCIGTAATLSWPDALALSKQAPWRLPNVKEMVSLLDHSGGRFLPPGAFPGNADFQWSSSPIMIYRLPMCVAMQQGVTSICNSGTELALRLVRERGD